MKTTHDEHAAAMNTIAALMEILGTSDSLSISGQVAALKDQAQALAAENAGLKNAFGPGDAVLNFLTIALRHTTYDQIDLDDVTLAFKMSLPETPATDRFSRELKAQARNELIDELESRFTELSKTLEPQELRGGAAGAAAFVSAFRKGAAQ